VSATIGHHGRLTWRRRPDHEAAVLEVYERNGGDPAAAPTVHYGYDEQGREHLHALVSREEWQPGDSRWHVSISAADRVPTWDEIAATLHALRPGVPFVLGVPPRSWWMNAHPYVLHAWETKDWALIEEWRRNARGDVPS
jgi:hypothetical protein